MASLGHLDLLTSNGVFEGWAFDFSQPLKPLSVFILDDQDREVASGLPVHFRADLADRGCAFGWCHFRLRSAVPVPELRQAGLRLYARKSGERIHTVGRIGCLERETDEICDVGDVARSEPLVIHTAEELLSLEPLLEFFVARRGVAAFVMRAYTYVLGRGGDEEGLTHYCRLLSLGRLTPGGVVRALAESAEFESRRVALPAPNSPQFPF